MGVLEKQTFLIGDVFSNLAELTQGIRLPWDEAGKGQAMGVA